PVAARALQCPHPVGVPVRVQRRAFFETLAAMAAMSWAPSRAGVAQMASMTTTPVLELWYTRAARTWVEALPVGNGRVGGMVFGGVGVERVALNDDTLWSGGPGDWNNPDAREALPEIRRLVAAGRFAEADA